MGRAQTPPRLAARVTRTEERTATIPMAKVPPRVRACLLLRCASPFKLFPLDELHRRRSPSLSGSWTCRTQPSSTMMPSRWALLVSPWSWASFICSDPLLQRAARLDSMSVCCCCCCSAAAAEAEYILKKTEFFTPHSTECIGIRSLHRSKPLFRNEETATVKIAVRTPNQGH